MRAESEVDGAPDRQGVQHPAVAHGLLAAPVGRPDTALPSISAATLTGAVAQDAVGVVLRSPSTRSAGTC